MISQILLPFQTTILMIQNLKKNFLLHFIRMDPYPVYLHANLDPVYPNGSASLNVRMRLV